MFELVFLGTSASAPSIYRGLVSTAVLAGEQRFLVDCGEGTQRQILRSGIGFKRLNRILLTHSHLDHILGLGGLISTFVRWEDIEDLHIWGGKSALERVKALIYEVVLRHENPAIPINLITLQPGIIHESKSFVIRAFPVTHRGRGCFGFIFQEHTRRPFLVEKAEALGIPPGPDRGQLVKGKTLTLADGRTVTPDEVLGEEIPGTKIVFTGDIARTDNIQQYVQDADALVIEGTFLDRERDIARNFGHITVTQAATLAEECGVRNLFIHHISRRYHEREVREEAQQIFSEAVVVRDLDHYTIHRGKSAVKKPRQYGSQRSDQGKE